MFGLQGGNAASLVQRTDQEDAKGGDQDGDNVPIAAMCVFKSVAPPSAANVNGDLSEKRNE